MSDLVHMKNTPAAVKKESNLSYKPSPYPYGLEMSFDTEQLKKLGITELPEVGGKYSITATGNVTHASKSASESGEHTSMRIQITHLKLETDDSAEEKKESPSVEKAEKAPFDKSRASNLAKMMR